MQRGGPAQCSGMTLLEIMVVVVIIAVLISISVLSLGDNSARRLSEESRRVQTLLRLAADDATLQSREIGIAFEDDNYRFLVYDDQFRGWQPVAGDPVFRRRQMPDGIEMDLYLDDQQLVLPVVETESGEDSQEEIPTPQVLILSSGEMTPFELHFESDGTDMQITVQAHANGLVEEHVRRP